MRAAVPIWVAALLASAPASAALSTNPVPTPAAASQTECSRCHTCPEPSNQAPCLTACPRLALSAVLSPDLGPDVVILDELEDLYVPVRFDHKKHAVMAGMSKGCGTCHHFTPPDAPHPACKSCHPVGEPKNDLTKPGLKGAYHRRCLGCHREWDRETTCEICHEKRKGGPLGGTATKACDHTHFAPIELKDLILFPTSFAVGDIVPFHHRNHSQRYERNCTECHRQERCTRCHVDNGEELHPMGGTEAANLHDTCFRCHDGNRCKTCHGRDPAALFSHADTGWPLKAYHVSLPCRSCHGRAGAFRKLDPRCATCHEKGLDLSRFDHAVTGATLDQVHREFDCDVCHTRGLGSPARCDGCHDDGRTYDRSRGFTTAKSP